MSDTGAAPQPAALNARELLIDRAVRIALMEYGTISTSLRKATPWRLPRGFRQRVVQIFHRLQESAR